MFCAAGASAVDGGHGGQAEGCEPCEDVLAQFDEFGEVWLAGGGEGFEVGSCDEDAGFGGANDQAGQAVGLLDFAQTLVEFDCALQSAQLERCLGANQIDYIFADISQPLDNILFRYLSDRERQNRTR